MADELGASLDSTWGRELFDAFVEYEMARVEPKALARRLKSHLPPFKEIAGTYTGLEDIETSELLSRFSAKEMRKHESVFQFLRKAGIKIPGQVEQREKTEHSRAAQAIHEVERPDHRRLLQRFIAARYGSTPATGKTIRVAVNAARGLLAVSDDTVPTQAELRAYLAKVPGQRAAVSAFIGYLKSAGTTLKLPPAVRQPARATNNSLASCFAMLTRTNDYAQLRAAIGGVIVGLLGLSLDAVVQLPMAALRAEDGGWVLTVEGKDVLLDPRLHPGLELYLSLRKPSAMSEFLFPGRNPYQHVDVSSVTYHFKNWGVSPRELGVAARADLRSAAAKLQAAIP